MASLRQNIMRALYPALMKVSRWAGKSRVLQRPGNKLFQKPIHALSVTLNDGSTLPLTNFKGKKLLLVNTASNCGYTAQYNDLQALQDRFAGKLQVIGFPANDFKEQEQGDDKTIAQFCQVNFGVRFPLAKKARVLPGDGQQPVYRWLTQKEENGWNSEAPSWNFSKYLLNEEGLLTHYFDPAVSPLSLEITRAVAD